MDHTEEADGTENNGFGDGGDKHKCGRAGSLLQFRNSGHSKPRSKTMWWQDVKMDKQTSRQGRTTPEGKRNRSKLEQIKIFVSGEQLALRSCPK